MKARLEIVNNDTIKNKNTTDFLKFSREREGKWWDQEMNTTLLKMAFIQKWWRTELLTELLGHAMWMIGYYKYIL